MSGAVAESDRPPPSATDTGWRPAHDDDSARAVAWRARRAHALATEHRSEIAELKETVRSLNETISTVSTTWGARWDLLVRTIKYIFGPVAIAGAVGAAAKLWIYVSSLHH